MGKRKPFYGVAKGRNIGVFTSWEDCEQSVKGYSGAAYRGFNTHKDAMDYVAGYTLLVKKQQDATAAAEKARAEQNQRRQHGESTVQLHSSRNNAHTLKNSSEAMENVPPSKYARIGSYADLEEDDFVFDGTSSDRAYYIDDNDEQPQHSFHSMKRTSGDSPNSHVYTKKMRTTESDFIDLTSSPPLRHQDRYGHSANYYPTSSLDGSPSPSPPIFDPAAKALLSSRSHAYEYSPSAETPPAYTKYTLEECSPEQKQVLDLVSQGKNVFFTGSAGVGKSFVLQKITELLKSRRLKQFSDFFITASTGIAAVHVGGTTIHSFSGIGKGEDGVLELKKRVKKTKRTRDNWKECKVLVIDEVSMISDDIFDKLDEIGRHVRGDSRPFGGIQLVLCGDFYQLPPVSSNGKRRCPNCGSFNAKDVGEKLECLGRVDPHDSNSAFCRHVFPKKIGYIFQSKAWKHAKFNIVELTKIYRQSDSNFVTALNKVREGKADFQTLKLFDDCRRPLAVDTNIKPTKMYPIRALVQEENSREFEALKTPIQVYTAIDSQSSPDHNTPDFKHVLNDLQATKGLRLRVGCQVMLLANLNITEGLVNGSRGIVIEFVTLKEAEEYLARQAALRGAAREEESIAASELHTFANGNESMLFPRVLFELKNKTREVIITPYTWTVQLGWQLEVSRVQIPLMTAWALTIHKCQDRCFGYGMAYVALSRCKSLEGLQIVGWKGGKEICADPVVEEFYKSIKDKTLQNFQK